MAKLVLLKFRSNEIIALRTSKIHPSLISVAFKIVFLFRGVI